MNFDTQYILLFKPAIQNIQNLEILQGKRYYIFPRITHHFEIKLCNFTNFKILYLALAIDLVFLF